MKLKRLELRAPTAHLNRMTISSPSAKLLTLIAAPSWRAALAAEFQEPYMATIADAIDKAERSSDDELQLSPRRDDIYRALNLVPIKSVRAVIVGQDPYPHIGDADGLAFSYRGDGATPNGLGKVLAEAKRDLGWKFKPTRDLTSWAEQGVLLLNAALTNLVGSTWAHGALDWQQFIGAVLRTVAACSRPSAIMLWGEKAAEFSSIFEGTQHKVFKSDHPCASRSKGELAATPFAGSRPFSRANAFLMATVGTEISWTLPSKPRRRVESRQRSRQIRPIRSRTVKDRLSRD